MFYHNIDPAFLRLGSIEIRYYGILYALGFFLAFFFLRYLVRLKKINLNESDIENFLVYEIVGAVIGARIFEILFYNPKFYFSNPSEIIALWHGGLSFHGGLVGALIAAYIFCRKKEISFLKLADICAIPLAFGLFLGRIGNFINGELYGTVTNLPWGVKFQDAEGFRHPTQIYESLKNLFIFSVLWSIKKKEFQDGKLFGIFLILYSAIRFFIEFIKVPEAMIFGLTMGQFLNIPMLLFGIYLFFRKNS